MQKTLHSIRYSKQTGNLGVENTGVELLGGVCRGGKRSVGLSLENNIVCF